MRPKRGQARIAWVGRLCLAGAASVGVAWLALWACVPRAGAEGTSAAPQSSFVAAPGEPTGVTGPVVPSVGPAIHNRDGPSNLSGPNVDSLFGITCPATSLCYAVVETAPSANGRGTVGLIVTVKRSGGRWAITQAISVSANIRYLNAISCSDMLHWAAVGEATGNIPVVETTSTGNGTGWAEPAQPTDRRGPQLYGVSCSASSCMAVGYYTVGTGRNERWIPVVWATTGAGSLAGEAWAQRKITPSYVGTLWAVDCTAPGNCWAAGNKLLHTTNDGGTWRQVSPMSSRPTCAQTLCLDYSLLDAVNFVTPQQGYVDGGTQCGAARTFSCPGVVSGSKSSPATCAGRCAVGSRGASPVKTKTAHTVRHHHRRRMTGPRPVPAFACHRQVGNCDGDH